jgi:hypothetical protein
MLVASPPIVVLPVSSASDLLQVAHSSVHTEHSMDYILRQVPSFFLLHCWQFLPFDRELLAKFLALLGSLAPLLLLEANKSPQ